MVRSICFTGHRHIVRAELPALLKELRRVLETAIPQGFVDFYAGGALGWDTYCAQTVLDLREEYPCIALHLVLPCSRGEQTARWTEAQKAAYDCIFRAGGTGGLLYLLLQRPRRQKRHGSDCAYGKTKRYTGHQSGEIE